MGVTPPRFMGLLLILGLILGAHSSLAQQPQRLTGPEVSPAVWGVLETPRTAGPHAAVVLLPGSFGWRPAYAQLARDFADSGFVALAIDYYAETGRVSSREEALRKWPAWQATVRNGVAYLVALKAVSGRPAGIVGFSQGASLAISVASSVPGIRAVVDFYGGGGTDSLEKEVGSFPPLLILHGEADSDVPVALAYRLRDAVLARGGEVEMHLYPGAQHGFNVPFAPAYSARDARDSWWRTIEFLRRRLAN